MLINYLYKVTKIIFNPGQVPGYTFIIICMLIIKLFLKVLQEVLAITLECEVGLMILPKMQVSYIL